MVKKIKKYLKFVVCCALILSLIAPSYAALSASDGSAFVTKAEFDSALADFNARLTTFEAGINSKIDSQVSSYLDRNGIWNSMSLTLNTRLKNNKYDSFGVLNNLTKENLTAEDWMKFVIPYLSMESDTPLKNLDGSASSEDRLGMLRKGSGAITSNAGKHMTVFSGSYGSGFGYYSNSALLKYWDKTYGGAYQLAKDAGYIVAATDLRGYRIPCAENLRFQLLSESIPKTGLWIADYAGRPKFKHDNNDQATAAGWFSNWRKTTYKDKRTPATLCLIDDAGVNNAANIFAVQWDPRATQDTYYDLKLENYLSMYVKCDLVMGVIDESTEPDADGFYPQTAVIEKSRLNLFSACFKPEWYCVWCGWKFNDICENGVRSNALFFVKKGQRLVWSVSLTGAGRQYDGDMVICNPRPNQWTNSNYNPLFVLLCIGDQGVY